MFITNMIGGQLYLLPDEGRTGDGLEPYYLDD